MGLIRLGLYRIKFSETYSIWLTIIVLLGISIVGCGNIRTGDAEIYGVAKFKMPAFTQTGSNKVQVFSEMHYQPSYKSQEGPRLLSHPESVPVTGREIVYYSLSEYQDLVMPELSYDATKIQELYDINCLVCHGGNLRGDSQNDPSIKAPILDYMSRGPYPADLLGDATIDSKDGEIFAFISNGGRQGYAAIERGRTSSSPMPEFRFLLTENERWALVRYIREAQGSD
tara:strand:- start:624 stop:1307 length:684 start_codon:yes stop_codon:yes gene_type:complete